MRILLILLSMSIINGQSLFEGQAGDVWHLTGSTLGVLTIQRATDMEWHKSAAFMFCLGFMWEVCDETIGTSLFDSKGFNERDLWFDGIGCLLSYPLRYKNCELKLANRQVNLCIRF